MWPGLWCSEPTLNWRWCWCFLVFFAFLSLFFLSVKARKGSAGHKRRLEAGGHGRCRLCPLHQSNPVCGSDGHSYSSKARVDLTHAHTRTTRFSSLHPSQSLHLSLCCGCIVGFGLERLRSTRTAHELFSAEIDGVNIWNCLLSSSWQMRFKLSSSVTLLSSVPRPSPCTAAPLIYWSQSLCAAWNGVTYHEGFRHLRILSLCSLSTQSALFHQADRGALQKRPGSALPSTPRRRKEPIVHFLEKPRRVAQSRWKVQHRSGRVQKNTVSTLLCFSDGRS